MVLEAMPDVFGVLFQYPDGEGVTSDLTAVIEQAKAHEAQVVVAADLMALALLKNPGTMGRMWWSVRRSASACRWVWRAARGLLCRQRIV